MFLLYLLKLPESLRWLLANNRNHQAQQVLDRIAQFNKVPLTAHLLLDEEVEEETCEVRPAAPPSMACLFTHPTLRLRFVIMALNWVVTTLGYYGLSLSSAALGNDVFSSFALAAAMEIPSYIFCMLSLDRVGRRGILAFSQILAGSTCVLAALLPLPDHLLYLKTLLVLVGKFGASAGFAVVFVYTAELFPTPMRNSAVGLCSTAARLGGILAPFVASLAATSPFLPFLVMGCGCCLGGLAALVLPETAGLPLPDTVEEAGRQGRNYAANLKKAARDQLLLDKNAPS